jgi:hypothetical protein
MELELGPRLSSRAAFALVLVGGVAGTGLLVRLLNVLGYPLLGSATWAVGYVATIVVLWYGWFRKMDITGQSGAEPESGPDVPETGADVADPDGDTE